MPARPLTVSLPFSTLTISGLAADLPSPAPSSLLQAERLTHIRAPARVSARGCLNFMGDLLRGGIQTRIVGANAAFGKHYRAGVIAPTAPPRSWPRSARRPA